MDTAYLVFLLSFSCNVVSSRQALHTTPLIVSHLTPTGVRALSHQEIIHHVVLKTHSRHLIHVLLFGRIFALKGETGRIRTGQRFSMCMSKMRFLGYYMVKATKTEHDMNYE